MSDTPIALAKIATSLGWMKSERNGIEVWYDPEGGHVVSAELLKEMGEAVPVVVGWLNDVRADVRKLETDNAALRADLERFTGHGMLDCHAICDQRDAAIKERDALRAALERIAKGVNPFGMTLESQLAANIASAALEAKP